MAGKRLHQALAPLISTGLLLLMVGPFGPLTAVPVHAAPAASLADDLVAYWNMDELTGTRADSVNGHDLAAGITPGNPPGAVAGVVGNAVDLNGVGQYLVVGDNPDTSLGDVDFTIAGWLKADALDGFDLVWGKQSSGAFEYGIKTYSASGNLYWEGPAGFSLLYTSPITTSVWHFVYVTHNAATDEWTYGLNGSAASTTSASYPTDGTNAFYVGHSPQASKYFQGQVDELGIWKRVLSPDELSTLYNGGDGCTYPFNDCEGYPFNLLFDGDMELANPEAWWQFSGGAFGGAHRIVGGSFEANVRGVQPVCGNRFQQLGGRGISSSNDLATKMVQSFSFGGGAMHVNWSAHGDPSASRGETYLDVNVLSLDTGTLYPLRTNQPYGVEGWDRDTATVSVPAGDYELQFEMGDAALNSDGITNPIPRAVFLDDVWVSNVNGSACGGAPVTPTPTPTRTATPTRTPTGTQPTATPNAPVNVALTNCAFTLGSTGWQLSGGARVELAGGPVGAQYAYLPNTAADMAQRFTWSTTTTAYFTFWTGPHSDGQLYASRVGGAVYQIWSGSQGDEWQQQRVTKPLPAGTYDLHFKANSAAGLRVDGVAVGRFGYTYCNGGATPTSGPTSFVTATRTPTPTSGASPTPTRTTAATSTRTPGGTSTAQATYTPRPSSTPRPTDTQLPVEKTATAQGTAVATYTPPPTNTPTGGGTGPGGSCDADPLNCPVPEQPEVGPDAQCVRPQFFWQVAQWIDYTRCEALKYVTWSNDNTQQIASLEDGVADRFPFGFFLELRDTLGVLQSWTESTNWCDTGICRDAPSAPLNLEASGILTGNFDFSEGTPYYSADCDLLLAPLVGPAIQRGACFCVNVLCALGLLPWFQLVLNTAAVLSLFVYVQKTWMRAAHT